MSILHVHAPKQRERTAPCALVTDPVFAACLSRPLLYSSGHRSPSASLSPRSISSLHSFSACSEHASSSVHSDKRPLHDCVIAASPEPMSRPRPARALSSTLALGASPPDASPPSYKTMDQDSTRSADPRDDEPTAISGLSILNDETDEFYQRSLEQLRRDRQHLRTAANHAQPFRRARPATLSLEPLDRKKAASDSSVVENDAPTRPPAPRRRSAAAGLERAVAGLDAPPQIQRDWGRKGRTSNDFLRRITSAPEVKEESDPEPGPLPTNQDSPSPLSSRRGATRPARATGPRVKRSTDDLMARGRGDSSASGGGAVQRDESAEAKQREIESVKDKAVTTSRLAEVARRSLRVPNTLASAFRRTEQSVEGTMDNIIGQLNSGAGSADSSLTNSPAPKPPQRSRTLAHRSGDSRDLLKRFARASSSTPSPQTRRESSMSDMGLAEQSKSEEALAQDESSLLGDTTRTSLAVETGSSPLRAPPSISRVPTRSSSLRSSGGSPRKPSKRTSLNLSAERVEETPGAWVETPAATKPASPVQKPLITDEERPDPLRSHPVTPEPEPSVGLGALPDQAGAKPIERTSTESLKRQRSKEALPETRTTEQQHAATERKIARRHADPSLALCPHCHEALPPAAMPTLWDVTAASVSSVTSAALDVFAYKTPRGQYWPTRTFWLVAGVAAWLWLELWLCDAFCPYYCRFWFPSYTDMQISEPRFPFVTAWKLVLEPTQGLWRPGWQAWLAFVEPRGWGLAKRTLWGTLKRVRLDWLFGPGDERLEGRWDWPWWWSYLYGAQYGIVDPNCILCPLPGA